jgi:hypothetical protein
MRKLASLLLLLGAGFIVVWTAPHSTGDHSSSPSPISFDPFLHHVSAHSHSTIDESSALGIGVTDLFVDAAHGSDSNNGQAASTAFRTLQRAAEAAMPGTVVRILPGVYRETVRPRSDGTAVTPITYVAEDGPGTVTIRGSEASMSLTWTQLSENSIGLPQHVDPSKVYVADLSGWSLTDGPRFVMALDSAGKVTARLPLAREPDWQVQTDWKYHEFWWTADGGSDVSPCDPSAPGTDWECDLATRRATQLTDRSYYAEPAAGIQAGDLTSLGDLAGADLVSLDAKWGHYLYRRTIVSHDVTAGRITVTDVCLQDGGVSDPGLGWGSKYYIENHPALLDSPGEWWYDAADGRLYLWPLTAGDPASQSIEISKRDYGFDLTNRSYITLDGLALEIFNKNAVDQVNYWAEKSHGNTLMNLTLRYANHGIFVEQSVRADQPAENVTRGFTLLDSEISHMDTHGLFMSPWWDGAPSPDTFPRSGVYDTVIRGNEFHHLGFRAAEDNAIGLEIQFPDRITFEDNHVHDVAHNGVQFLWSVIDSAKSHGFSADEIKIGEILVKDNIFEDICQLTTDCGALKFWGEPPTNHVFRDVLVTGNTFRDVAGWSYVATQRVGWWSGGEAWEAQGQAGFGLYLDYASGIHAYRNVAYNNSYAGVMLAGTWRDGDLVFVNNTVANSLYGFRLSGIEHDTHGGSVNTQIINNLIIGNEGYGIYQCAADENFGNLRIDHNLYFNNGWRLYAAGGVWEAGNMAVRLPSGQEYYPELADIQNHPFQWETHGVDGDPHLLGYDPDDHEPHDSSWPDFRLTSASEIAIDGGSVLPASLTALLGKFNVADPYAGSAFDIGWREGGLLISVTPATRSIQPGESAEYKISVRFAGDDTSSVTLTADSPDPSIQWSLTPSRMTSDAEATLVLSGTDDVPAGVYEVLIGVSGAGFDQSLSVSILVAQSRVFLPLVTRH